MPDIPKPIKALWNVPGGKKLPVSQSFMSASSEDRQKKSWKGLRWAGRDSKEAKTVTILFLHWIHWKRGGCVWWSSTVSLSSSCISKKRREYWQNPDKKMYCRIVVQGGFKSSQKFSTVLPPLIFSMRFTFWAVLHSPASRSYITIDIYTKKFKLNFIPLFNLNPAFCPNILFSYFPQDCGGRNVWDYPVMHVTPLSTCALCAFFYLGPSDCNIRAVRVAGWQGCHHFPMPDIQDLKQRGTIKTIESTLS